MTLEPGSRYGLYMEVLVAAVESSRLEVRLVTRRWCFSGFLSGFIEVCESQVNIVGDGSLKN